MRANRGQQRGAGIVLLLTAVLASWGSLAIAKKDPPPRPVDINVANVKELEELPGVGPTTAQSIINFRQKSGRFHRIEDLLVIRGISRRKFELMRPYLTVGTPPAPKPATAPARPPTTPAKPGTPPAKPSTVPATAKPAAASPAKPVGAPAKPAPASTPPAKAGASSTTQTTPTAPAKPSQPPAKPAAGPAAQNPAPSQPPSQ